MEVAIADCLGPVSEVKAFTHLIQVPGGALYLIHYHGFIFKEDSISPALYHKDGVSNLDLVLKGDLLKVVLSVGFLDLLMGKGPFNSP